jgi:diaminopimelate decarboxylase/aspartate kinase
MSFIHNCVQERVDSRTLLTSSDAAADEAQGLGQARPEADTFLEADVRPSSQPDRGDAAAQGASVVICQGFIASTPSGATCILGRGGSDTSAVCTSAVANLRAPASQDMYVIVMQALFASLVGAERLEIWTDVNGMFTADPRFVPRARLIRSLTYREAQELAAMGAKVRPPPPII